MATTQPQKPNLDRYVVIHVATTCDEHGVYVTKDSAEVIELGWILLDAKSCEEVGGLLLFMIMSSCVNHTDAFSSSADRVSWSSLSTLPLRRYVVSQPSFEHSSIIGRG